MTSSARLKIDALLKLEQNKYTNTNSPQSSETPPEKNENTVPEPQDETRLQFDMSEAEELLSVNEPTPEDETLDSDPSENEIKLLDPDIIQAPPAPTQIANAPTEHKEPAPTTTTEKLKTDHPKPHTPAMPEELDPMTTLILPPGMEPTHQANQKRPESPEQIKLDQSKPDQQNSVKNIEFASTVILPPGYDVSDQSTSQIAAPTQQESTNAAKEESLPPIDTDDEDGEYARTLVLAPVANDAVNPESNEQEPAAEIARDDTLIMHTNDFDTIKKDG